MGYGKYFPVVLLWMHADGAYSQNTVFITIFDCLSDLESTVGSFPAEIMLIRDQKGSRKRLKILCLPQLLLLS